jgi:hypothetical protein
VNEVLNTGHFFLFKVLGDDEVGRDGDSLLVDSGAPSLVDEVVNDFSGWVSIGDVRLHESEHPDGGFGGLNKHGVVELPEPQKLQGLSDFGSQTSDTVPCKITRKPLNQHFIRIYPLILVARITLGWPST